MNLRLPLLSLTLVTSLLVTRSAQAVYPYSDCDEWAGMGTFGGWVYIDAKATLQKSISGTWTDIEDVDTTLFLPSGGRFLLAGEYAGAGTFSGTFRTKLRIIAYFNGSGSTPPTPTELASWPS